MKTTQIHTRDKSLWLTPHIKEIIKQRQRAYSKGYMVKYRQPQHKAAKWISKAKLNYYQSKSNPTRTKNPAKWFKSIYSLCGANESGRNTSDLSSEHLTFYCT